MRHRALRVALSAAIAATGFITISEASPASAATWSIVDLNTAGVDATRLAQEIAGQGVTITSATFTGDNQQGGLFSGLGVADAIGVTDGVVMSSGIVGEVVGPNNESGNGESFGGPGDAGPQRGRRPAHHARRRGAQDDVRADQPRPADQLRVRVGGVPGVRRLPVQRRVRVLGERRRLGQQLRHGRRPRRPRAGHDQHDQPPAQHADLRRQPPARDVRHPVRRFHPAADLLRDGDAERRRTRSSWRSPTPATRSWTRPCSWSRRVSRRHRRRGTRRWLRSVCSTRARRRQDPGRRHASTCRSPASSACRRTPSRWPSTSPPRRPRTTAS